MPAEKKSRRSSGKLCKDGEASGSWTRRSKLQAPHEGFPNEGPRGEGSNEGSDPRSLRVKGGEKVSEKAFFPISSETTLK